MRWGYRSYRFHVLPHTSTYFNHILPHTSTYFAHTFVKVHHISAHTIRWLKAIYRLPPFDGALCRSYYTVIILSVQAPTGARRLYHSVRAYPRGSVKKEIDCSVRRVSDLTQTEVSLALVAVRLCCRTLQAKQLWCCLAKYVVTSHPGGLQWRGPSRLSSALYEEVFLDT